MDLSAAAAVLFIVGLVIAMYVHAPLGIAIISAASALFKLDIIAASMGR